MIVQKLGKKSFFGKKFSAALRKPKRFSRRSAFLVVIVIYKSLVILCLLVTLIALFLGFKNYQLINSYTRQLLLEGNLEIIRFILYKTSITKLNSVTLYVVYTGLYALLTGIEAMGLWYKKKWVILVVISLICFSIPLDMVELIKSGSVIKVTVFLLNLAMFWYLRRYLRSYKKY